MASREPAAGRPRGFTVGPAHLPDGTYKRKVQKIKKDLAHRAKVRRSYEKLKAREPPAPPAATSSGQQHPASSEDAAAANLEPHPSRQAMMADATASADPPNRHQERQQRARRPKPNPFYYENLAAQRAKEAAVKKQEARAAALQEKAAHHAQRERWRKEMAKARGQQPRGGQGKRKLGRESKVLLEKVQRMMEREKEEG